MPDPINDYAAPPPAYAEVIEKAISDWTKQLDEPLTLPVDERVIGSLALLITKRLVQAGLIDADRKRDT